MRSWTKPVPHVEVRWPWYLAVDVSHSMRGKRLQVVEATLPALLDVLEYAVVEDATRLLAMLEFAGTARLVAPLDVLNRLRRLPGITASGGSTSFGGLFGLLRELLARDVRLLHADGYRVLRPVLLLLTDGETADEWEAQFYELTEYDSERRVGFPWYPIVLPIGVLPDAYSDLDALSFPPGRVPTRPVIGADDAVQVVTTFLQRFRPEPLPTWRGDVAFGHGHGGQPVTDDFS